MSKRINRKEFLGAAGATLAGMAIGRNAQGAVGANPITIENAKPGTSDWFPNNPAQNREIEGFADLTSVAPGGAIRFYVNTTSKTYRIDIYRLGWYGGAGGRLYKSATLTGIKQTMPTPDATTGLVECKWKTPYSLLIPSGTNAWTTGMYIAKLTTTTGVTSHIPFVVRDDTRVADHLFQSSVTTCQAYNSWGGKSLYEHNSTNGKRAYKVSFNRPYFAYGSGDIINEWSGWELNTLRFMEREGYDVSYCTNIDTHQNSTVFYRAKSFLSVGHDEYWSLQMRFNVEYERNTGRHLGFLGANTAYWQVRFENGQCLVASATQIGTGLYRAGLDRGDVLLTLDNVTLTDAGTLDGLMRKHSPADLVLVKVRTRGGVERTAQLVLTEDPNVQVVPGEMVQSFNLTQPQKDLRANWLASRATPPNVPLPKNVKLKPITAPGTRPAAAPAKRK